MFSCIPGLLTQMLLIMWFSVWMLARHTQDTRRRVLPLQAAPKVQLSTSGSELSDHWFDPLTYSSIDTDTVCQSSLTQWILPTRVLLSADVLRVFPLVFMEIFFSTPDSIGALPGFRWRLHFSRLICILRAGSHWKDQGNLCVASAGQLPGRLCRFH